MKILATEWIGGRIGVVCYENEMGKRSVTIAPIIGESEELDAIYVAEWGHKLPYSPAWGFFPNLINKENFKF